MKKISVLFICIIFSVCAFAQIEKVIPAKPNPPRLVNDFANILIPEQEQALEDKLVKYDDSTSNQIVIVTLPTLKDPSNGSKYDDHEVALKILREWGVGQKDRNNGIVVLIVKNQDNTEKNIRIEVGYGLEGAIPDITAKTIIDNEIVPNFREENYYRGLDEATDALIKAAAGEYTAPAGYHEKNNKGIGMGRLIPILVILWIILRIFGGGNRGGGMMSRRGFRGFRGPIIFPGGGWGSGGGGGFGGGGGGFGGFGGGGGGGGGASGSW